VGEDGCIFRVSKTEIRKTSLCLSRQAASAEEAALYIEV
jgi:hypothetical protein